MTWEDEGPEHSGGGLDLEQVVMILVEALSNDGESIVNDAGEVALDIALEMGRFIQDRLEKDGETNSLWGNFLDDPEANAEELQGELEAMVEADPSVAEELEAFLLDYEAELEPDGSLSRPVGEETQETPSAAEIPEAGLPEGDEGYNEQGTYLYGNVRGET